MGTLKSLQPFSMFENNFQIQLLKNKYILCSLPTPGVINNHSIIYGERICW